MDSQDVMWRLLDRLSEDKRIFNECFETLDAKKDIDLRNAILECERLIKTQENLLHRIRRRYNL